MAYEKELAIASQEDSELLALRAHLKKQEQSLAWERIRVKELEGNGDVIKKGKASFAHMEV